MELHLLVAEIRPRSLAYQIRIRRIEPGPVEEIGVGRLVVVCASKNPDGKMEATAVPESLARQLEVAPAELLVPPGK